MKSFLYTTLFLLSFNVIKAQEFNIIDLGFNSYGNVIIGIAMNDSGHVAGYSFVPNGAKATIWKNGSYELIQGFGMFQAINIKGQTIGITDQTGPTTGFIYSPDTTIIIGTFGGPASDARGLNDSGWATGSADVTSIFDYNAYIYKNGSLLNISSIGNNTSGIKINNLGHVSGTINETHGSFFYNGSTMINVDTLPGYFSVVAVSLNDGDKIIGWMYGKKDGYPKPFLWDGASQLLPILPGDTTGKAMAINNHDIIAGGSGIYSNAVIWRNKNVINLNTLVTPQPGLVLTDALDINNNGQILCEATLNGTTRYYILDPISTGINSEKDNFPKEFTLYQNYPNPFNPVTTLRYSIPQNSNVKLVVYDILGKEVVTLVNEEKHGGTYELNWNAVNLPSGVYFYQLQAGSFVENKKMVLLK